MKIAYFVDRFPLISETFILGQIAGMIDRGHEVTIFANRRVKQNVQHRTIAKYDLLPKTVILPADAPSIMQRIRPAIGVVVKAIRARQFFSVLRALNVVRFGRDALNLKVLLRTAPYIGDSKYDVIHCQFGQLGVRALIMKQCGVLQGPLVTSFRGTDAMKIATNDPERFAGLFMNGDRFLAVSEIVRQRLIDLGCPRNKINVLRSGIDLTRFTARKPAALHQPAQLLSIGRLAPNKGIEYCLTAIRQLLDSQYNVEYLVLGDGPSADSLKDIVRELGLESCVFFEGDVSADRVIAALNDSDFLVTPSVTGPHGEQEGLPNTLKEAMAVGVPSIGTDTGGIPELIENDFNGFLVQEKNPSAIANCVMSLIDNWLSLDRIITNARRTVEQEYDLCVLNDAVERIYLDLSR